MRITKVYLLNVLSQLRGQVWLKRSLFLYIWTGFPVHPQLPELSQTLVHWVGDAVQPSFSVVAFSSCLLFFPASRSFPISQFFASGGQSIGVSAFKSCSLSLIFIILTMMHLITGSLCLFHLMFNIFFLKNTKLQ